MMPLNDNLGIECVTTTSTPQILATCHNSVLYLDKSGALRHAPIGDVDRSSIIFVRRTQSCQVVAGNDTTSEVVSVDWGETDEIKSTLDALSVDLIMGNFVQIRGDDGAYVSAGFNGSVVRDRPLARHWETFALLDYSDALQADLLAAQRLLIDSVICHSAGESERALRALNAALDHNSSPLSLSLAERYIVRLRAVILSDLGRWDDLASISGPLWDLHHSTDLKTRLALRAQLDGIAAVSGADASLCADASAGQTPPWIGLAKLPEGSTAPSAESQVHHLSGRNRRVRTISLPRKVWPDETGGIVTRARLVGGFFICYGSYPGVIQYGHRDASWYRHGGISNPRQTMQARLPTDRIAGLSILVGGHFNYFHNIVEYLINYFYVRKYSALWSIVNPPAAAAVNGATLILLKQNQEFLQDLIQLLDIDTTRIYYLEDRQTVLCDRLVLLPQAISGIGVMRDSSAVRWFQAQLVRKIGLPGPPRRLYISRSDATRRRVVNEDQVRCLVERYGFEFVQLSGLPVAKQFELFRDAEIVMGPHGAGFTNLVATMRTCTLVELLPVGPPKWSYYVNLTEGLGHRHIFFDAQCVNDEHDMMIEVVELERLLKEITWSASQGLPAAAG